MLFLVRVGHKRVFMPDLEGGSEAATILFLHSHTLPSICRFTCWPCNAPGSAMPHLLLDPPSASPYPGPGVFCYVTKRTSFFSRTPTSLKLEAVSADVGSSWSWEVPTLVYGFQLVLAPLYLTAICPADFKCQHQTGRQKPHRDYVASSHNQIRPSP